MVFRDEDLAGGSGVDESRSRPPACMLYQCVPNPVNSTTIMRYDLQEPARVNRSIRDVMGRTVRALQNRASMGAGIHSVIWDGNDDGGLNVSAGVYFYRLDTGFSSITDRMLIIRWTKPLRGRMSRDSPVRVGTSLNRLLSARTHP